MNKKFLLKVTDDQLVIDTEDYQDYVNPVMVFITWLTKGEADNIIKLYICKDNKAMPVFLYSDNSKILHLVNMESKSEISVKSFKDLFNSDAVELYTEIPEVQTDAEISDKAEDVNTSLDVGPWDIEIDDDDDKVVDVKENIPTAKIINYTKLFKIKGDNGEVSFGTSAEAFYINAYQVDRATYNNAIKILQDDSTPELLVNSINDLLLSFQREQAARLRERQVECINKLTANKTVLDQIITDCVSAIHNTEMYTEDEMRMLNQMTSLKNNINDLISKIIDSRANSLK